MVFTIELKPRVKKNLFWFKTNSKNQNVQIDYETFGTFEISRLLINFTNIF